MGLLFRPIHLRSHTASFNAIGPRY